MSVIKVGFLVITLAIVISGQVARYPPSTNSKYPEHCWIEDLKQAVKGGENWTDRETCVDYVCSAEDFSYIAHGCGAIRPPDECTLTTRDKTKDYPDCCPQISCK